ASGLLTSFQLLLRHLWPGRGVRTISLKTTDSIRGCKSLYLSSVRRRSECVSLGHVNKVEQRAADTEDGRNGVGTLLKSHRAGGDFVQAIINCTWLVHVRERNVNRDSAISARGRVAVGGWQLGHSGICQGDS